MFRKNANTGYQAVAAQILIERKYYTGKPVQNILSNNALKAAATFVADCEPGALIAFSNTANPARLAVGVVQCHLRNLGFRPGKIDGYVGPMTEYALLESQGKVEYFRDLKTPKSVWPKQDEVPTFFGEQGQNQVQIKSPYPLVYSWNNDIVFNEFQVHEKVADSATRILESVTKAYSEIQIREFGLNQFGASFNVRLMRGSKSKPSLHSWGIAQDWYPQMNHWLAGRDQALFSHPEYAAFIDCFEAEGWHSMGRERNCEWGHFQAAET